MPDWLTKASKTLGRRTPADPKPFEIPCQCGRTVRGMRRTESQRVVCGDCGERLFVLPIDVYPQPAPKKNRRKKPAKSSGNVPREAKPVVKDTGPSLRERLQRRARDVGNKTKVSIRRSVDRQKALFTPFRLVVLCIVAVVAATTYWMWHVNSLEQAEAMLKTATDDGFAALREQRFTTAQQQFRDACKALDVLGRDDGRAEAIRQMLRESTALSRLVDPSVFALIEEADDEILTGREHWADLFRKHHAGRWIGMEAAVTRHIDSAGSVQFAIDFPLMIDGKQVCIEGNLAAFEELPFGGEPRQVIFAAQLDDCVLTGPEPGRWVISLQPESAFLWSDLENCFALGFSADEFHEEAQIRQVLAEQSEIMGITR